MIRRTEMLKETADAWQDAYAQPLTPADAAEIYSNVCAFFNQLDKWSRTHTPTSAPEHAVPPAPQAGGAARSGAAEGSTTTAPETQGRLQPPSLQSVTRGRALAALSPMPAGHSVAVEPPSSNTGVTIPPKELNTHASKDIYEI